MANRESPEQRAMVRRVMHEFKHGELASGRGGKVKSPKQAIAIALSEAGASTRQSEATNRQRLRATKRKERAGQTAQAEAEGRGRANQTLREGAGEGRSTTRKALYAEAARRGIKGRARMTKAELAAALR